MELTESDAVSKSGTGGPPQSPSEKELRLSRRVLELEAERDALALKVQALEARLPTSPTVLVNSNASFAGQVDEPDPGRTLTIPNELLPTLALLKRHISDLTRDNDALRYTFLGSASRSSVQDPATRGLQSPGASSSKVTLDVSMTPTPKSPALPQVTEPKTDLGFAGSTTERQGDAQGVDLEAVVRRVRELIKENDELGEMIIEAGRSGGAAWQELIDDAKRVIESLETDLTQHAAVVERQREEIEKYKSDIERLKTSRDTAPPPETVTSPRPSHQRHQERRDSSGTNRTHQSRGSGSGHHQRDRSERAQSTSTFATHHDDRGNRDRRREDERRRDREPDASRDKDRNRDRQRDGNREKERERDRDRGQNRSSRDPSVAGVEPMELDTNPAPPSGPISTPKPLGGLSIRGSHQRQQNVPLKGGGPKHGDDEGMGQFGSSASQRQVGTGGGGAGGAGVANGVVRDERMSNDRSWKRRR